MARRTRRFPAVLSSLALAGAALASTPASAAELGEAKVSSHIGQLLVADIELATVDDPASLVQVRLASPEVYNGAGIAMPKVLSMMNLSVVKRDGRQFVHVTTLLPVASEHLHLYLELVDKGQRVVRLATLWLTPDPNPAPAVAAPAPVPVPAPLPPVPVPVRAALPAPAVAPAPPAKTALAVPAPLPAPPRAEAKRPRPAPVAAAKPLPLALGAHGVAAPATCAARADEARACTALGEKNAQLQAKLGSLEERVKGLQASLGVPAAAKEKDKEAAPVAGKPAAPAKPEAAGQEAAHDKPASAAEAKPQAEARQEAETKPDAEAKPETEAKPDAALPPKPVVKPAGPKPISSIKPLVPRKPKEPPPDEGLPWGWIGAVCALLALGGSAAALLLRRGKTRNVDIPAAPGLLARLKARFATRGKAAPAGKEAEREVEPSFE